jgi:pimeloyl-ACP methyl ester carboxylesterase
MSQANTVAVRNVVLVHGGLVDGSGWEGVYRTLRRRGYTVSSVQNPTTSLADDVAVTKRTLAAQNGPAMLVGHSYGGVVVTEAGHHPKVAGTRLRSGICPGCRRVRGVADSESGAWRTGARDSPAAGRISLSRQDAIRGVVRGGCECRRGGVHGGFAGAVGAWRRSQTRSANRRGEPSRAGTRSLVLTG